MPLWLDLLRTPMAAPETSTLRRMRRTWQGLCLTLTAAVLFVGFLSRVAGHTGQCMVAALLIGTVAYTVLYLGRKHRTDQAFLEELGRQP